MPLSSARRPMSSPRRWCTRRRPFFNPLTGQTSHQTVARPNVSLGPRRRTLSRTHPRPSGTASSRTRPSPRPGRADAPFLGPGDDPFSTPSTAPSRTLISDPSRRRLGTRLSPPRACRRTLMGPRNDPLLDPATASSRTLQVTHIWRLRKHRPGRKARKLRRNLATYPQSGHSFTQEMGTAKRVYHSFRRQGWRVLVHEPWRAPQ